MRTATVVNELLDANIAALFPRNPALGRRIATAPATSLLAVIPSRSGEPVPVVRRGAKSLSLHSLFDPRKEAERLRAAIYPDTHAGASLSTPELPGYLLFEGLGAGYQILAFLASPELRHALVMDTDPALLKELFSRFDLTPILEDPRIELLVDPSSEEVKQRIRSTYLPAVMGGFRSLPLRPRVQTAGEFFESRRNAVRAALEDIADDLTVQSAFGHQWSRNILANLPLAGSLLELDEPFEEAIVTAAGPSLEEQIGEIKRLKQGRYIIATDTSLPVLLEAGLVPDAALTIDCQNVGYHHYLCGIPPATTLFAELSAPPSITRLSARAVVVAGAHPLSRLAAQRLGAIVPIDTSGGNVGHAAVSLAFELGAKTVHLFGADFSYPDGKPYARGTYVYSYFAERQARTSPLESGVAGLMYRDPSLEREDAGGGFRYTTQRLLSYRRRFEQTFLAPTQHLRRRATIHRSSQARPWSSHGHTARPSLETVRQFLSEYRDAVALLPDRVPSPSAGSPQVGHPGMDSWQVFATIYPLIAWLRGPEGGSERTEILISQAKELVLAMIDRSTSRQAGVRPPGK